MRQNSERLRSISVKSEHFIECIGCYSYTVSCIVLMEPSATLQSALQVHSVFLGWTTLKTSTNRKQMVKLCKEQR